MIRQLAVCPLVLLALGACGAEPDVAEEAARGTWERGDVGPTTRAVDRARYAAVWYVSTDGSDQMGDGSAARPWRTIGHALERASAAGPGRPQAILVAAGVYREPTLELQPYVDLFGGFERGTWRRDIVAHKTVLDGEGLRRIALGADHATMDGLVLRNGRARGHGGALLLEGVSSVISNNVFVANSTLPPDPWSPTHWHETAHDGGAVACRNGCSATIANNLFLHNTTAIGRGGAVACDNEAGKENPVAPRVVRNVFLGNASSVGPDTMRSGDGGAISFYGYCNGEIADNVVAENRADARNDGGGIFLNLWAAPRVAGNVIVGNRAGDDAGGLFVGGQKHHYGTPLDPVPPAERFFVRVERNVFMGNRTDGSPSGAFRITMMTRGAVVDNIVAENPGGVYTQRSELTLANNTFVDEARNEDEDRTAPGPTIYRDNLLLGRRQWGAPVTEERNCTTAPGFVEDGLTLRPAAAAYDPDRYVTRFRVRGRSGASASLAGRVVQVDGRWGVVRWNDASTLEVWGDFHDATVLAVKPTYRLKVDAACAGRGADHGGERPL